MTKNEVLKQVYDLSVNGNFNREIGWSFKKFKDYVNEKTDGDKAAVFMEIELPDGWWMLAIRKINSGHHNCWDYYIPDTQERNEELRENLRI